MPKKNKKSYLLYEQIVHRSSENMAVLLILLFFLRTILAQQGSLNIASGSAKNYTDERGMLWVSDFNYIGVGKAITLDNSSSHPYYFQNLRTFPQPLKKSCYHLPILPMSRYMLRLWFAPYIDHSMSFTYTIETEDMLFANGTVSQRYDDRILTTKGSELYVCLIRQTGDPFISGIQLTKLEAKMYSQARPGMILSLIHRYDIGNQDGDEIRYPSDQFDRIWAAYNFNGKMLSTNNMIQANNTENIPPSTVMQTAQIMHGTGKIPAQGSCDFLFLYFAQIGNGTSAMFTVVFGDSNQTVNLEPRNSSAVEVDLNGNGDCDFTLTTRTDSNGQPLNALLNALEVYSRIYSDKKTDSGDVNALTKLGQTFKLNHQSWISDPCYVIPWDYISCNGTRISEIDISGRNLSGAFPSSIASLTGLRVLNLSHNRLEGPLPDLSTLSLIQVIDIQDNLLNGALPIWISKLKFLKELLIQNNKFSGKIPEELQQLPVFSYSGNLGLQSSKSKSNDKKKYIIGTTISGTFLIIAALFSTRYYISKRKRGLKNLSERTTGMTDSSESYTQCSEANNIRSFSTDEMISATKNFKKKIGSGGFGSVYYGKLDDEEEIAVKVLSIQSKQGRDEFVNELQLLSRLNHKNLVRVIGYCDDSQELMIVYEFMHGGSLKDHLRDKSMKHNILSWKSRLKIALDAATGLEYMHIHCKPKIIHRDLKSANILLDNSLNGKISDLGLSKGILDEVSHITTSVKGTLGYMDPEYFSNHMLSEKSDIYSFGVVLLEMICGRPPIDPNMPEDKINLIRWVRSQIRYASSKANYEDSQSISITKKYLSKLVRRYAKRKDNEKINLIIDKGMKDKTYSKKSVGIVTELAMACVRIESWFRPNASDIVRVLKEAIKEEDDAAMSAVEKIASSSPFSPTSDESASQV